MLWCDALSVPLLHFVGEEQLLETLQLLAEKELRLRHELPEPPPPQRVGGWSWRDEARREGETEGVQAIWIACQIRVRQGNVSDGSYGEKRS